MISKIKVTSGYAAELKCLKDRTFEFTKGINILWGPNGCGKSTLLKVMAGHMGVRTNLRHYEGGWTRPNYSKTFPAGFIQSTIGECDAEIEWDGSPTFLHAANVSDAFCHEFPESKESSPDGLEDYMEAVQMTVARISDGQKRLYKLGKVAEEIKSPPTLQRTERYKEFFDYLETLPRTGPRTILFDEPDRSLNYDNQIQLWFDYLIGLSVNYTYQVIVSTHSAIPLLMPKEIKDEFYNIIDLEEGDYAKNRRILTNLFKSEDKKIKRKGSKDA